MVDPATLLLLFDPLPDTVFFMKDREGRYTLANRTLLQRLGLRELRQLKGRSAADVFPQPLGANYLQQDRRVLKTGSAIIDELERHLFPNHAAGWCLTRKIAIREDRRIIGLIGISRDINAPAQSDPAFMRLQHVLTFVRENLDQKLSVMGLAESANLSVGQLERQFHRLFQLTPRAWILSLRLERAMTLLVEDASVSHIAAACGFSDHSAFSRAFRRHVGLSPRAYRLLAEVRGMA